LSDAGAERGRVEAGTEGSAARTGEPVTRETSLELYRKVLLTRRSEEAIIRHYAEDEMKTPMHMSMGEEAIAAGVCQALGPADALFGTYRSHALFLARTGDTDGFFGEMYGKVTGTARGKAGSMHLAAPEQGYMTSSAVVGSCIPLALGAAFARKRQGQAAIACTFFGDGAAEEGVFWESLNVASVMKLPVLFVCEDNGFAVHSTKDVRQGFRSLPDTVRTFDCTVHSDDTTDVEAIYRAARRVVEGIRRTGRPALMHLKCYRYLEHVGVGEDFAAGYRDRAECDRWRARDCVEHQRRRLLQLGLPVESLTLLEGEIEERVQLSVARAKAAPFPGAEELLRGVFHEGA
jgi:TPP-dependent pyruvate/acetoin dehydrogenase alpha subunit